MTNATFLWKQAEASARIIPRLSGAEKRKVILKMLKIIISAIMAGDAKAGCTGNTANRDADRLAGV